jgi:phospholipid/cholesterol/gamma-HCH transport system substrate-binding protein
VKQLTDEINAGKGAIGTLARNEEFAAKLQNTMNKLSALTDQLEAGQGTAGMLLKNPSLYNNSDQMLIETRQLLKAIRENPKKYLTFHVRVF